MIRLVLFLYSVQCSLPVRFRRTGHEEFTVLVVLVSFRHVDSVGYFCSLYGIIVKTVWANVSVVNFQTGLSYPPSYMGLWLVLLTVSEMTIKKFVGVDVYERLRSSRRYEKTHKTSLLHTSKDERRPREKVIYE